MRRELLIPRIDWPRKMEALGFHYHSIDGIYWDERAAYSFSAAEIDLLEDATNELHARCLDAAQHVIDNDLFDRFAIPAEFVPLVRKSWEQDEVSLFGRFDLSWDGSGAPKLLEYNADTPTSLLEASVAQWFWKEEVKPSADQFNSLHEKLIEQWKLIASRVGHTVHFAAMADSEEDMGNLDYLRDVALQAGIDARLLPVESIGWDSERNVFVDVEGARVHALFKLYPWEWLARDTFAPHLLATDIAIVEPAWKMLLSNKAILPVLWELFPDHPNLLPAYFDAAPLAREMRYVKKPLLSREGANVELHQGDTLVSTRGEYGAEGFVYQALQELPNYPANGEANYMVIGSWIVGDEAAGIGIREDESPITKDTSRFLPHYFE